MFAYLLETKLTAENVVRLAHASAVTPSTELAASGSVAIAGFGDTARMGPPRPRTVDTSTMIPAKAPLSPARQALENHRASIARLSAEVERVSKPVDWLRGRLDAATGELQHAEANLSQIDHAHAAALAQAARDGASAPALPPSSAGAEEALQRSRRNVNSVRQALTECTEDQLKANNNLAVAQQRFGQLTLAVMVEEHAALLREWAAKKEQYIDAEAALLGLEHAIGARGRDLEQNKPGSGIPFLQKLEALRRGEHGAVPTRELTPHDIAAASSRWLAVLRRLETDAGADFAGAHF
jgi:hypothetical protein